MIKLSCNSCGAKLELTDNIDRFCCMHCGSEWMVNKGGGVASLKPVEEGLKRVEEKTEKVAENTEILADQVRIGKMRDKINQLCFQISNIDQYPKKQNPNYDLEIQRHNSQLQNIEDYKQQRLKGIREAYKERNKKILIYMTAFLVVEAFIGVLFIFVFTGGDMDKMGKDSDLFPLFFMLAVPVIIGINLLIIKALWCPDIKIPPLNKVESEEPSYFVLDEDQLRSNLYQISSLQEEVNELTKRIGELENKI